MDRRERVFRYLTLAGAKDIAPTSEGWTCVCFYHDHYHRSKGRTLAVNVDKGMFYCHSTSCGRSGFFTTILVERCGFSFRRALDIQQRIALANVPDLEGIQLPPYDQRKVRVEERIEYLNPAILGAYDYCPKYMLQEGFTKAILQAWDIGFDRDERRVTLPVWDRVGRLVGISTRAVSDDDPRPRYLHPFPKGLVLYGENRADLTGDRNPLVLVEGQKSVLWASQHGVQNVVSTLGSQVSKDQLNMASRYRRVVLAFDADGAGISATWFSGRFLSRKMGPERIFVADQYAEGTKDLSEQSDPGAFLERLTPWTEWELTHDQPIQRRTYRQVEKKRWRR